MCDFLFLFFQKIITDFVTIEMAFHAKALEVYSQCFQNLNNISIDADIKVSYFY